MYKIGDLFAGVGGVALGFLQAGFSVSWSNELDPYACETYKNNFPQHKLIEGDIIDLPPSKLGYVDVITSGFPCQAFSIAGKQLGFKDPRGNLFFETANYIDKLRPKAFLLENVKNLRSHDNGKTIEVIRKTLVNDLNYSCKIFLLSAYEHGNIPQNRERIYIVGFREDIGRPAGHNYLFNIKPDFDFYPPKPTKLTNNFKQLLLKGQQDSKYYFSKDHKYIPILKEYMTSKNLMYQWRRKYVRTNKKGLCPTLTANMGTGGHNVPLIVDNFGFRRLTPRECFNFQGFPNTFVLPKTISDSKLYKQAGNSVTVPVIKRIATEIKKYLEIHTDLGRKLL